MSDPTIRDSYGIPAALRQQWMRQSEEETLLDDFAKAALTGLLSSGKSPPPGETFSSMSFKLATDMLNQKKALARRRQS